MTSFIFDECFDDKRAIANCNSQNLCKANRYPRGMRGTKDNEMLPVILSGGDPLVTLDYDILDEHSTCVPALNAGVIIVKYVVIKELMKSKSAAIMLSNFKTRFKDWDKQNWNNIRLEITEEGVVVSKAFNRSSGPTININYDGKDFEAKLTEALREITAAARLDAQQRPLISN